MAVVMRIASVEWRNGELDYADTVEAFLELVELRLREAVREKVQLVVLPAFSGAFFQQLASGGKMPAEIAAGAVADGYLSEISELSSRYQLDICPGSYWETDRGSVYHTSCVLSKGKTVLKQRQIYLARWEREAGLERGHSVSVAVLQGFKTGIVLSTDVFYPQVSRNLLALGADLVLSPVGFTGCRSKALQFSGMWEEVQQNLFYAVESGFNGKVAGKVLWGKSILHAPVDLSPETDGILAAAGDDAPMVSAEFDLEKRLGHAAGSDVLKQLNPDFYWKMNMFGGGV
jgi:predicted amidohydrolase